MADESPAALLIDEQGRFVGVEKNPLIARPAKYNMTPFGQVRTASPYTLADLVHLYEANPADYGTSTATGGTVAHVAAQSAIRLTVTASSGSTARIRTHSFFRYQAGKAQVIKMTCYHADTGQANQVRRWGYFDDNDGLFFALSGTTLQIVRRTSTSGSPVDNVVAQSAWNVDKLDGTGDSGVTLDITKGNIYEIHFQWLGVGTVNMYVNGILVHEMLHANTLAAPYMRTAQLPVALDVVNTGASTGSSLTYICASVSSEGGQDPPNILFTAYNATDVSVTTTERPVLSIRPKMTYNSVTNRMILRPSLLSISTEGARMGFRIVLNAVLTGASWASVDALSGAEFDVSATSGTGGLTLFRGFLPNAQDSYELEVPAGIFNNERGLRVNAFATAQDSFTVFAVNEAIGNTNVRASGTWSEIR